jgi:hypothetical protein
MSTQSDQRSAESDSNLGGFLVFAGALAAFFSGMAFLVAKSTGNEAVYYLAAGAWILVIGFIEPGAFYYFCQVVFLFVAYADSIEAVTLVLAAMGVAHVTRNMLNKMFS